jgi:hypothetical protein
MPVFLCLVFLATQLMLVAHVDKSEPISQPGIRHSIAAHGETSCEFNNGLCCQICLVIADWTIASDLQPRFSAGKQLPYPADLVKGITPKPLKKPPRRFG